MLEQFLASAAHDPEADRGAFQLAWRPAGSRPLSAALSEPTQARAPVSRPALPSFELL